MGVDSSISGLLFTPAFAGEEDLAGCPATDAVALMRSLHVVEVEMLVEDPLHGRRPILRAWKGMRLDVERDVDLGVPQSLLDYLGMDPLCWSVRPAAACRRLSNCMPSNPAFARTNFSAVSGSRTLPQGSGSFEA
jgi:hypothetical protein